MAKDQSDPAPHRLWPAHLREPVAATPRSGRLTGPGAVVAAAVAASAVEAVAAPVAAEAAAPAFVEAARESDRVC